MFSEHTHRVTKLFRPCGLQPRVTCDWTQQGKRLTFSHVRSETCLLASVHIINLEQRACASWEETVELWILKWWQNNARSEQCVESGVAN